MKGYELFFELKKYSIYGRVDFRQFVFDLAYYHTLQLVTMVLFKQCGILEIIRCLGTKKSRLIQRNRKNIGGKIKSSAVVKE